MKIVLVFGVFDNLHDGHRFFLKQARTRGDYLVAVVARDEVAEELKKRRPRQSAEERMRAIETERFADKVVLGDVEMGEWNVVTQYRPAIVALGYDQVALKESLEAHRGMFDWDLEIIVLAPHEPEKFHSRLMRGVE